MDTKKKMEKILSLTYEGRADFSVGGIWLHTNRDYERLADVVHRAILGDNDDTTMRCRIQLTIERLPDDKMEVEVV